MLNGDSILEGYEFLNQKPDTLLIQSEADKVISVISSDEYIGYVQKIITELCESEENIKTREVFYITSRGEIIDAINKRSKDITDIITNQREGVKQRASISVVMAYALNEVLINMACNKSIKNINDRPDRNAFISRLSYAGEELYSSATYTQQSKSKALRAALEKRSEFYQRREGIKNRLKNTEDREKTKQGLIQEGVLIEIGKGTGKYRICGVTVRKAQRRSSFRLYFSKTINGTTYSIQRSISEHGRKEAFRQVLVKIQEAFGLSPNEIHILSSEEYIKQELYSK